MIARLHVCGLSLVVFVGLVFVGQSVADPNEIQAADGQPIEDKVAVGTLSGTVVDPAGKVVAGARVSVRQRKYDRDTLDASYGLVCETTTDAEGHFQLGPVEASCRPLGDVLIEADNYALEVVPRLTYVIYPGADNGLGTIQLNRGCEVTGQVIDSDGQPRANTTVECFIYRYISGHTIEQVGEPVTVTTDGEGRFRTPPLPVGKAQLVVRLPDRQIASSTTFTIPSGERSLPEPIRLKKDVPVQGRVVDEAGQPLEGVAIYAFGRTAETDASGRFVINGFAANPNFQFNMAKEGHIPINWSMQIDEDGFKHRDLATQERSLVTTKEFLVTMPRVAWIEGDAVDAESGEPVEIHRAVLCTFYRKPDGELVLNACGTSPFEQPSPGHFRVPYTKPQEYHLTLSAKGFHDGDTFTPPIKNLQPIDGLVVKLKQKTEHSKPTIQTQRITGTVTRNGRPVSSGWVALWVVPKPRNLLNAPIMRGRTTAGSSVRPSYVPIHNGTYTLDVPKTGKGQYVVVDEPGYAITQVGPLEISANETKQVDIECVAGGSIHGTVKNVPAVWQGNLWAVAFNDQGLRAEARIDADGNFSLEHLPPGTYGLKVGSDGFEDAEVPRELTGISAEERKRHRANADPWQRAVKVNVTSGQTTDGVELETPAELAAPGNSGV